MSILHDIRLKLKQCEDPNVPEPARAWTTGEGPPNSWLGLLGESKLQLVCAVVREGYLRGLWLRFGL